MNDVDSILNKIDNTNTRTNAQVGRPSYNVGELRTFCDSTTTTSTTAKRVECSGQNSAERGLNGDESAERLETDCATSDKNSARPKVTDERTDVL